MAIHPSAAVLGPDDPAGAESAVTDLATLPVILKLPEMARIYRVSVKTIRLHLAAGTFRPLPWDRFPYRWLRDDVALDLSRRHEARAPAVPGRPKPARAVLSKAAKGRAGS
jgi:hypothetical protein